MKLLFFLFCFLGMLEAEQAHRTKVMMGTFITITTQIEEKRHIETAFEILQNVENALSSYKEGATVYELNKHKKVVLDPYTSEALSLCSRYYEETDGYFDITVGSITKKAYHFGEDERIPAPKEFQEAFVDFHGIGRNEKEAYLASEVTIDLGGMGKGFGVDKVAGFFRKVSLSRAQIAASGDIRCLGSCKIEVTHPFETAPLAGFETLGKEMGITTSGNYNRFVGTPSHNHLIDPKQKASAKNFTSITLVAPLSNSDLDAYATAVSVMPRESAYSFLQSKKIGYVILQSDGVLKTNEFLLDYVKNLTIHDAFKK